MIAARLPDNESERVQVLTQYQIMDTVEEQCFDELVLLASKICDAPISIISLLDHERSWFKSAYGVPRGEVERQYSICSHAILQSEVFVVEDAQADERFHDNPIVTGELNVRFYAGAPLKTSCGHHLGTLCILDSQPRTLNEHQIDSLRILAHQVVTQLELRRTNQEILDHNNQLKQINESKDKFFSIIAHDLRAPFHGILGFSEVLETEIETLDEQGIRDIAGYLRSTAHATFKLLENLLQWAMSEGGTVVYRPQEINVDHIFQTICEILNAVARQKNIRVHCDVERNLNAFVDINMLTSVLQNLTSNALKFTNSGGHIYLKAIRQDDQVIITVQDTGIGMSKDAMANFSYRKQIASEKGTHGEKGTGLGLLLCRQFVEKNNGTFEVESELNKGTTFRIAVPVHEANIEWQGEMSSSLMAG